MLPLLNWFILVKVVMLLRNYFFPMDLSDDENVRKRELRQVVDAFEYYVMEHSGVVILSTNTVVDYFYLLMGESVRYYDHYTSTACTTKTQQSIRLQ
jgi:hypothetical protein